MQIITWSLLLRSQRGSPACIRDYTRRPCTPEKFQRTAFQGKLQGNYFKKNIGDVQLNVQILTIHPAVIFEDSESLVE